MLKFTGNVGRMRFLTLLFFIAAQCAAFAATGPVTLSGKVVSTKDEPVIGAAVLVKSTGTGVTTSIDGEFTIQASVGDVLEISCLGYETATVTVKSSSYLQIVLEEDSTNLDEVVVVGYGTQKKATLTGSVAAIGSDEIVKSKNENVQNMLTGKVAGLRVVQMSAEPGAFNTEFNIRGLGSPLIIIDGIPRDNMERIDANDIESISILKDASAAIYGVKAANGVVLITTKSGADTAGKVSLSYNANFTWQYTAGLPKTVGAVDFMLMENEKGMNSSSGGEWRYTQEEIDAFRNGTKRSVDWYDAVVKNGAPQYSHNINVSGGSKKTQYFASLGYQFQDSFFRSGDFNYERFNLRVNVNSKINDNLSFSVRMSGIMDTKNASSESARSIIYAMWRQYPTAPIYENDHEGFYSRPDNKENPVQMMQSDEVGYNKTDKKWVQTSISLKYDVPFVKGLSAGASLSYDYSLTNRKEYEKEFFYYTYDAINDVYSATALNSPSKLTRSFADNNSLLYQFSVNYDNVFKEAHHVSAALISESRHRKGDGFYASRELSIDVDELFAGNNANQVGAMNPSSRFEYANQSYIARLNYDYKSKIMIEGTYRYDGSSRFAKSHRWGGFPSVSAGYRISEEKFWKNNRILGKINNLKIRASYGVMGDDSALDYQFLTGYTYPATVPNHKGSDMAGGYGFGGVWTNGMMSAGIPNTAITWYQSGTANIGVDLSAWHGMLGFSMDVFRRDRTGLLATSNTILPGTVGASLPQENLNSDRTLGYEIELSHKHHTGDLFYSISGNMSLTRTMIRFNQHSDYRSAWENWKSNVGYRYQDIWWGYGAGGQYQSWEEIAEFPVHVTRGKIPGDYYYEDWNGDGFIDSSDEHPIGYKCSPLLNFGINMNLSWKGLDLSMLFQGAALTNVAYTGQLQTPLWAGKSAPLTMFLDRWRPTDPTADPYDQFTEWTKGKYAMMGSSVPDDNSAMNMYDGRYIRLKNIELGYSLPAKILAKANISEMRVFVNAYNILTFSPLDFVDPEHPSSDAYMYPLNRTFSLGLNLKF